MHLAPLASAAVLSKAVVLLLLIHCLSFFPLFFCVCVFDPCLVMSF